MAAGFVILAPVMAVVLVLVAGFAWNHACDVHEARRMR